MGYFNPRAIAIRAVSHENIYRKVLFELEQILFSVPKETP
jgi:hypothetical protein